jgi:aryl-alcohol dehydrogenase-like predicted oxidoreductase
MTQPQDFVPLGKTNLLITRLGTGAWAWGDRMMWGYGSNYHASDTKEAFDASLAAGINFFDTAEVYGNGVSERLLGGYLKSTTEKLVVATKFMPYPWRLSKKAMLRALRGSLKRMDLQSVDLYQIHWPFPPMPVETWADALADLVQAGLVRAVGVSNYSEDQMRRAYTVLAKRGVPLASNQVNYSLLDRKVEFSGLLKACQELGITLIAYSPLAKGALTGKYSPEKPMPGLRNRRYSRDLLEKIQPLIQLLRNVGREHGGKTPAQVALNWCMCKGTIPIPGAKNARQAQDNCAALGWELSQAEVAALDEASADLS